MQHESNPGLHVENAGAVQTAILDLAWHVRQCAQGVDRVVMAKEQDWLSVGGTRKIDLQAIAEVMTAVELNSSARRFEFLSEDGSYTIDCLLVVARGFNLHQFANCVDDVVLFFCEKAQAFGPRGLRGNH
jgi:hypothetical protein